MVHLRVQQAREAQRQANLAELEQASWRARWTQLAAPILGLTGYVAWIWSDLRYGSMRDLPVPLDDQGLAVDPALRLVVPGAAFARRRPAPVPATTTGQIGGAVGSIGAGQERERGRSRSRIAPFPATTTGQSAEL